MTNPIIPLVVIIPLLAICLVGFSAAVIIKKTGIWIKILRVLRIAVILTLVFMINLRIMTKKYNVDVELKNIDVLFVVDTTISMWAVDYGNGDPRIEGVQKDAKKIVEDLAGSNFAIITFDDQSHVISPCTQDMDHIKTLLDTLAPPGYGYAGGSDMSLPYKDLESLLMSSSRKENRKSIVIFMSDGEITNGHELTSYEALKDYVDSGVVLGYGTTQGAKMKIDHAYIYDEVERKDAISYMNEDNLKSIAGNLGVEYYNMNDGSQGLHQTIEVIKETSKTVSEKEDGMEKYADVYYVFAIPLVLILILELYIFSRRGRL